jgi:hypothetical protein
MLLPLIHDPPNYIGPKALLTVRCSVEGVTAMADDRTLKGPQDRTRINLSEDYEVRYWCKKFGVTPDVLRAAVEKAGSSAAAVEKELAAG